MEFTLDDDQRALQRTVRSMLGEHAPPAYVREMLDDEVGVSPELWQHMVELGWVGLLVPEGQGGAGMGLLEMMVVVEEMGRLPLPGPFLSSAVWATLAARRLQLDDRLASLASGATRGTIAIDEEGHGDAVDRIRARASRKSGQWRLRGTKSVVLDGHTADWVLVPARTQQGIGTFVVEAPRAVRYPGLDVTRRLARLDLDDVVAEPVGPDGDQTEIWKRVVDDAAVVLCAESLGSMQQAFDLAVEYAKVRVQFDRPIATFQAIKHKAAEMLERIELSRVGVHYAAWTSDAEEPTRAEAAAMAKAFVGRAANEVGGESIQIHGGVGFTWDCDAHLHYRKAKANDLLLGYQGTWRERVADSYLSTAS
ncbi:MAG TPA: acyl-CoA dehydrogenase family protein [Acidimicrobiales bacterium]|nr:acyl-CoA dehydrogenase family protein [Acidimicrobiales bacterium]